MNSALVALLKLARADKDGSADSCARDKAGELAGN